jgi:hypothetical protein
MFHHRKNGSTSTNCHLINSRGDVLVKQNGESTSKIVEFTKKKCCLFKKHRVQAMKFGYNQSLVYGFGLLFGFSHLDFTGIMIAIDIYVCFAGGKPRV